MTEIRNPKLQIFGDSLVFMSFEHSNFVFVSNLDIRISDFSRIWLGN